MLSASDDNPVILFALDHLGYDYSAALKMGNMFCTMNYVQVGWRSLPAPGFVVANVYMYRYRLCTETSL